MISKLRDGRSGRHAGARGHAGPASTAPRLSLQVEGSERRRRRRPRGGRADRPNPGDDVELLVTAGPVLGLLAVDGEIEAYGARRRGRAERRSPSASVTCAVPDYLDLTDIVAGDTVLPWSAWHEDGVLTADEVELDEESWVDDGFGEDEPYDEDWD